MTVFLGGPPALILAAIAPLPENVPELMLASLIAGRAAAAGAAAAGRIRWSRNAEFALIGEVPPRERRPEGPFGDHYGYYSLQHDYPVFDVQQIARRRDAIYPGDRRRQAAAGGLLHRRPAAGAAVAALSAGDAGGRAALVVRRDRLPLAGAARSCKQRYAREAMASAFRILGEGQLSLTKFLLVTDRPVDLRDFRATLEHVLARTNPETDLYVFSNLSMDTLDYSGPEVNEGSKGVWLGLGDPVRELPREFRPPTAPPADVTRRARLLRRLPRRRRRRRTRASRTRPRVSPSHPAFAGWPLVVLTDEPRARRAKRR